MQTNTTEPASGPMPGAHQSSRRDATSFRRVLGEVSPNVRASAVPTASHLSKPMAGSPLKRSFTAAMEGNGFKYLKKRKMSSDIPLIQDYPPSHGNENIRVNGASVGHAHPISTEMQPPVPKIETSYPTEPNTPTSADDNDCSLERSSADRGSFSSLINYDPSSQTMPPSGSQQATSSVYNGPSRAELLRLRLKVAMFKVRTDQVGVPFEELEPEAKLSTSVAVEGAVALLRDQARVNMAPAPQLAPNLLLAAPVLKPTEYSSRMVYGPAVPSSPPVVSLAGLPYGSRDMGTPRRRCASDEAELTSSIVKGRVAEGLLGLRHGL